MTEQILSVQSLMKKYGDFIAVNNISFTADQGEILAFLGPNGAGKTTTVEMLECLKTPTSGSITIMGLDTRRDETQIKEKIGVMPQSFNAYAWLTVWENINYFGQLYHKHANIDQLIKTFGLTEKRNVLFKNLSGGLKQRVGIAIALVNDPELVFLDEPTTGLDPRARRDVWEAIRELKNHGKTVLLTTHYMDEAYNLADRICVLHKGSIVAEGSPEDLINQYGGGNTLIIRECSEATQAELLREIPNSRAVGKDIQASMPDNDSISSVTSAVTIISRDRLSCKEIYIKKSTLEDVFLNLTGEALKEGA